MNINKFYKTISSKIDLKIFTIFERKLDIQFIVTQNLQ